MDARIAFSRLDEAAPASSKAIWEDAIKEAESDRDYNSSSMDIMHSRIKTGATLKEITADLMREDGLSISLIPDDGNVTQWLLQGFLIEDEQYVSVFRCVSLRDSICLFRIRIRQLVRESGRLPTPDQKHDIEFKRQRVAGKIRDFHRTSERLLGRERTMDLIGKPDILDVDGYLSDDIRKPEDRGMPSRMTEIENLALVFPSSSSIHSSLCLDFRRRELRLRRAKANDALSHIRESLSGLSYQYINKVRQSKTTKEHLKAYSGVRILTQEVSYHRQVYNRTRRSIIRLDGTLQNRYPHLRKEECNISTAIAEVNAKGESQTRLAWFWGALDGYDSNTAQTIGSDNDRLLECKLALYQDFKSSLSVIQFIESIGSVHVRKRTDGKRSCLAPRERWFGQYCSLCIIGICGMSDIELNPIQRSQLEERHTANNGSVNGRNWPDPRIVNSDK